VGHSGAIRAHQRVQEIVWWGKTNLLAALRRTQKKKQKKEKGLTLVRAKTKRKALASKKLIEKEP